MHITSGENKNLSHVWCKYSISILTEKDMIEKDKILLNNIIKSKFIHCVDHEKTLSDVQIVYLSRYDVFLPRFGAKTCPQSNDSQHKESHRTEGKYSLSCANTHTHLMLEKITACWSASICGKMSHFILRAR